MDSISPAVYNHYALVDPRIEDEVARVRYIGRTARTLQARYKAHVKTVKDGDMSHRSCWMRELQVLGLRPLLIDLGVGPEEREAELISHWRRLGADLTNRSTGGGGGKGCFWSEERRYRRSEEMRQQAQDPAWRQKVSMATAAALSDPQMRQRISAGVRAHFAKPGALEKKNERQREVLARPDVIAKLFSPESQQKRSAASRRLMADPTHREKLNAGIRAQRDRPGVRAAYADRMRSMTTDPENIAKRVASHAATWRERRDADPLNEAICQMYRADPNKAEIARQLDIPYKRVCNRVRKLKKDGRLE